MDRSNADLVVKYYIYCILSLLEEGLRPDWVDRNKEVRERKKSGQDGKERINQEKNPQDLSVFTHIASLPASQRLFLEREHSALACNEQWESHHHATFLVGTRACWTDVISSM